MEATVGKRGRGYMKYYPKKQPRDMYIELRVSQMSTEY
jgi:hypothetical protein